MADGSTTDPLPQTGPEAAGHPGGGHRRAKAALFLLGCCAAGLAPHWLGPGRSLIPSIVLAVLLGGYSIRTVLLDPPLVAAPADPADPATDPAPPNAAPSSLQASTSAAGVTQPAAAQSAAPLDPSGLDLPPLDVVVAARDEQAVITRLVERIAALRYPAGRLTLWVIDDGSEDRTPELLNDLQSRYPLLQVLRRPRNAGGGKSGALNLVLPQLQGRWLLVLDADADLQQDVLERLIPWAESGGWAAVQLRKAVVNPDVNLLTRAQAMEMAFDAVIQLGRLCAGGVAELRGNGQLLRREAVIASGGFNEATVTDDLDLSMRLLLDGQPIGVLWDPPVQEEAVLSLAALWRQRQRWAEGGLQRFLDYAPGLVSDRLTAAQKTDLLSFFVLQYMMPVMAAADLAGVLLTGTAPAMWPFSIVALSLSGLAIVTGCRRPGEGPALPRITPLSVALGVIYLVHWFAVIPWVTLRMALRPKRLVWAKTLHHGGATEGPEDEAERELAAEGGRL